MEPRQKNYFIDTNVLLDDPESIAVLRNGLENRIFIPHTVLEELDKHKTDSRLGHQAQQALSYLLERKEEFDLLERGPEGNTASCLADNRILDEILLAAVEGPILVTNDKTMRIKAHKEMDALIRPTGYPHLDILPAGFQIRHLDALLEDEKKGHKRLVKIFETFSQRYDVVFLDCPPSISFLSETIFRSVDCLIMPVIPTVLAHKAFEQVRSYIRETTHHPLRILPFFSMFDWRKKIHREAFDQGTKPGGCYLRTCIPTRSIIEQMGVHRAPLPVSNPNSDCVASYVELWSEIKTNLKNPSPRQGGPAFPVHLHCQGSPLALFGHLAR